MYGDVVTIPQAITVCLFSIAVVFFVLFLISVLINIVARIINGAQKKPEPAPVKAAPAPAETETVTAEAEDDTVLTAIVAAAIAAATGKSTNSFVIKSITPLNQESDWSRISRSSSLR